MLRYLFIFDVWFLTFTSRVHEKFWLMNKIHRQNHYAFYRDVRSLHDDDLRHKIITFSCLCLWWQLRFRDCIWVSALDPSDLFRELSFALQRWQGHPKSTSELYPDHRKRLLDWWASVFFRSSLRTATSYGDFNPWMNSWALKSSNQNLRRWGLNEGSPFHE